LQAERVLQRRSARPRHHAQPVAQHLLPLGVATDRAKQVREVHERGRKLRLQRNRRPIGGLGDVNAAETSLERPKGDLCLRALSAGGL
jgi:hypothetical protein